MGGRGGMANEPDLGALIARVLPHLMALEEPILREVGLSMWEYAIVTELASQAVVSQIELSRRTRRDPTRLGKHLDDLAARGLVVRERSDDHRQRTVRLTPAGELLYEGVKKRIRVVEDEFLRSALSATDAVSLRHALVRLADASGMDRS
ncbi:MAG: winged helix DNA-binding protein [Thermomicrobiales bacterium]